MTPNANAPRVLPRAEDLVVGRWAEILIAKGMSDKFLSGKHGPCPFCSDPGKDKFRWNKAKELWVCNDCTNGKYSSGFELLRLHLGLRDFRATADVVREHLGVTTGHHAPVLREQPSPEVKAKIDAEQREKRLRIMQATWNEASPVVAGDPVDLYLRRRIPGIVEIPDYIRCHPALIYWQAADNPLGRPTRFGTFPAMLVRGFDPDGNLVQLHKTYITAGGNKAPVPDGKNKKTDMGVGSNSFALRLCAVPGDTLGVAEGIETALSALVLRGIPTWACHSASVLENFVVPADLRDHIRQCVIFADSDMPKPRGRHDAADQYSSQRRAGQEAARNLAAKLRLQRIRSMIIRPAKLGTDINDLVSA